MHFAGSEIGLCWNHTLMFHTWARWLGRGGMANESTKLPMLRWWRYWCEKIGASHRPELTTAGVLGGQSRLSYWETCAATCFRLRGDNLNEHPHTYIHTPPPPPPPITHKDGKRLKRKLERCNWIQTYLTGSNWGLESGASLVPIRGKYLLGHRQWERGRENTIKAWEWKRLFGFSLYYLSPHDMVHAILHILQRYISKRKELIVSFNYRMSLLYKLLSKIRLTTNKGCCSIS